ncbi:hypothetical protein ACWFMI_26015 [Nocardiopsis terrae]
MVPDSPKPPRPWYLIVSAVVTVLGALWLVHGRNVSGWWAFGAWDLFVTWLICLVLAAYAYVQGWVLYFQDRKDTGDGPPGPPPDPR